MQATLLGIGVAVILALVAALVGPHFIDWTRYRATIEARASALVGSPVRVTGPIEVRILPTPGLSLGGVEVRREGSPLKARELTMEFALASLVRGSFHAVEMRVVEPELALGLASDGRIDWRSSALGFDPEQFGVERFALEGGKLTMTDAGSGVRIVMENLWFNGELRSLLGPVKGEGGFAIGGDRYAYRLGAGRVAEDGSLKLRLSIDPHERPLAIEADGSLRLDRKAPGFEGTVTLSRPAGVALAAGRGVTTVPWRATGRVKATSAQTLIEQIEYQYGPEERAIKLAGTAEIAFGKAPRIEALLSARQVDIDRTLELPDASRRLPLAALRALVESLGGSELPVPARLGISIDAVTLAGATLQSVRGDFKSAKGGWDIESLELRAPGFAQVRLSGRLGVEQQGVSFKGPAQIDASDPKALLAWLEGREAAPGTGGQLRASGEIALAPQEIGVERLRIEIDRKPIEGRFVYAHATRQKPPRLEAELKAAELDIDALVAFWRTAFEGSAFATPGEIALGLDLGRVMIAGVEAKGARAKLKLDADGLVIDRIAVTDLGGATLDAKGRIVDPLTTPHGTLTLVLDASSLDATLSVLTRYLPQAAEPLRRAAGRLVPLRLRSTLVVDRTPAPRNASTAKIAVEGTAGVLRLRISGEATGEPTLAAMPQGRVEVQIAAEEGALLTSLLGLDRAIKVDRRPGTLDLVARSATSGDVAIEMRLAAGGLSATASGTTRPFAPDGATALNVALQLADAALLRRGRSQAVPVMLRTRLVAAGTNITLEDIAGTVASTPLRGRLKLALGAPMRLEGQIDTESLDVVALLAAAGGLPGDGGSALTAAEPFGESPLAGFEGQVSLKAARATLTPALTARQLTGTIRLGPSGIAFEDIEASLAGGRVKAQLAISQEAGALNTRAKVTLTSIAATALLPAEGRPAVSGRITLQLDVEGSGRTPASLVGSLTGSGLLSLEDVELAGLDPRAFDTVIRAVDQGLVIDASKIRDIATTMLASGPLVVPRLEAALTVASGQIRIGNTVVYGAGADLALVGALDLAEAAIDARLNLTGPVRADGSGRPEILVTLKGPALTPRRTVDVAALTGWLTVRSVERQARRIEAIESETRETEVGSIPQPAPTVTPAPAPVVPPARPVVAPPEPQPAPGARPRVTRPAPVRPAVPRAPVEQAPTLPPPLEIGPSPGNRPRPRTTSHDPRPEQVQPRPPAARARPLFDPFAPLR